MKDELKKSGLTMVEILIAVVIVVLLAGGMFFVSGKAATQAKIRQTQSTLMLLDTALEQYYDFDKTYPPDVNYATGPTGTPAYAGSLTAAIGAAGAPFMVPVVAGYEPADYNDAQSIEVVYYYLNRVPQSRAVLSKLHDASISAKAVKLEFGKPLASKATDPNVVITITGIGDVGLFRVVDAWNMPLQYIRYRDPANLNVENTNFPLLRSAGPDRVFGTMDDIINKKD